MSDLRWLIMHTYFLKLYYVLDVFHSAKVLGCKSALIILPEILKTIGYQLQNKNLFQLWELEALERDLECLVIDGVILWIVTIILLTVITIKANSDYFFIYCWYFVMSLSYFKIKLLCWCPKSGCN